MCQVGAVDPRAAQPAGELDEVVGYVLKRAAAALRTRMDTALRPLELTVPQYACLELLRRRPGLSNAELARGAFVTRQSMNGVLRGLLNRGLLTRPTTAPHGRARPTQLTPAGREQLLAAGAAVRAIEEQMLLSLPPARRRQLLDDLATCAAALNQEFSDQPAET
jgi:DNA-binding MarR family transcriptional regulator